MGYKILIVDDERDIVEPLKSRLLKEEYEVVAAYDGEEALAKIKEADPDVILLDLILPKVNGFEVLKEVRQFYTDKWRPVIIISAKKELDSIKKGYALEADHYLTKPCSMENILRAIETMISLIPAHKDK
ncbi:MAG: response regulator [Candidatus Omnitrophica bacterium]|nr:response regulator [Candidatus Omnitrophota bacterium]